VFLALARRRLSRATAGWLSLRSAKPKQRRPGGGLEQIADGWNPLCA
jgi:hypothetical protein